MPDDLLKPMDTRGLRQRIYDHSLQAVGSIPSVENQRYKLSVVNPHYVDPETWSASHQKKVFLQGGSLVRRIRGDWVLHDKGTGQEVDRKTSTIAAVPHLSDQGLFMLNGSHWTLRNQLRLDPGIYPRVASNGDIEAHVNPTNGFQHRISLDPNDGTFHLELGQSRLPLYPVLHALGATSQQLHKAWGRDLVVANAEKDDPQVLGKVIKKLYDRRPIPEGIPHSDLLAQRLGEMSFDPYVTQHTLGTGHAKHGLDAILDTTRKLLEISRGEAEPAERDHMAFQKVMGHEHLFADKISRVKPLLNQLLWKASSRGNLESVPAAALTSHLHETITKSGLGVNAQMTNPAETLDALYSVTRMGEYGIRSIDSIPDESRNVSSSHFSYIDPTLTPESSKAGVDLRFSSNTTRAADGTLHSKFYDHSGKEHWLSPRDIHKKTIGFPEGSWSNEPMIPAMRGGEIVRMPRKEVHYFAAPMEGAFSPVANMVPLKSASKAQRSSMGARMITQALPLVGAEAPLVQAGVPGQANISFDDLYSQHFGAIRAKQAGRVTSVGKDFVRVRYQDGSEDSLPLHVYDLLDHAPGRKTHFTQTPTVQPGDAIQPGQLLARSNYTDAHGTPALGLNARVAWLPAREGGNHEDAFRISQSFADRLRSDHISLHAVEGKENQFGKKNFRVLFPNKFQPQHYQNLDDDGVVKPGTIVQPGQPLILASRKSAAPRTTLVRSPKPIWQDASEVWDHDYPGEVVDVVPTRDGHKVTVKSAVPMQEADKLAGRYGNKGIVTIAPDREMPLGEDGKPFDVLVGPYTLASRVNPSQVIETILGKIAAKTGQSYKVPDFDRIGDLSKFAFDELARHGLKSTETVTDPKTNSRIPGVLTGHQYFMKLHHLSEEKLKQRDIGGYDAYDTPARGGFEGAKRMALADTFALLSHQATSFLRGSHNIRGQRNESFWESLMSGYTPHSTGVPMQYRRFLTYLQGAGINPVPEQGKLRLKALTDKDIGHLAGDRILRNAEGLNWSKGGEPIKGGLFDHELHGEDGYRFSKLPLHEPMPNPAFEDAIRSTLGLTKKEMRNVLAGKAGIHGGKYVEPGEGALPIGYASGPSNLLASLSRVDLDKEIAQAERDIAGTKKTRRDEAIKKMKFLQGTKDQGLHPKDWMLSHAPVVPPKFRPVSRLAGSNVELISDPNYLYSDLFHANENLKELSSKVSDTSQERLAVYDALKAVTGLGDPINPKTTQKNVKGLLRLVLHESPKWSIPQRSLLSSPVDLVGRSVIGPDSNLDMDEVGIPEDMAFRVYRRFLVHRMVRGGMEGMAAMKAVEDKTPEARKALFSEMQERPVSYHRAPVLHKYGHMGAWPKIVKGNVIKVNPFVLKGFNADFDGDQMNVHVPVGRDEIRDIVEKLMPSRNLLSVRDFTPHQKPEREFHVGLWQATQGNNKNRDRVFSDLSALKQAFARGEVDVNDNVVVIRH